MSMDRLRHKYLLESSQGSGDRLLTDSVVGNLTLDLNESSQTGRTKFRGKFQEAEAINKNKRMYPFACLDENIKRLEEAVTAGGLIGECDHPCLESNNWQALTLNGWKNFRDFKVGDPIYSRVNGEMVESRVEGIIDQPYAGPMIDIKGKNFDCSFTPPHKFVACRRKDNRTEANQQYDVKLSEIFSNRKKFSHDYIPKTASWHGNDKATITLPGVFRKRIASAGNALVVDAAKFAAFLGLYLAEGCIVSAGSSNRVVITQKNEYGRELIRSILSDFHPEIRWDECADGFATHDARLHDYLKPLGNKCAKYIPEEVKQFSAPVLEKLLVAFAIGNGRILKESSTHNSSWVNCKVAAKISESQDDGGLSLDNGTLSQMSMFSVSERLVDDLHECLVKCGRSGSRETVLPGEDYIFAGRKIKAENKKPLHVLNVSRTDGIGLDPRCTKMTERHYEGNIYCLKTTHGNFYMRHNGQSFWTGNCDSIIHFEKASHKITKLWWDGNTLMGEGEILTTPFGRLLKALISDGVRVGISSRGVGNGKVNEDGILVIGESYKLITFDAVADPSTHQAYQKEVIGKKSESVSLQGINTSFPNTVAKNESSSIHKVRNEQVLACFGGILKQQTNELKARLNNG